MDEKVFDKWCEKTYDKWCTDFHTQHGYDPVPLDAFKAGYELGMKTADVQIKVLTERIHQLAK